MKLCYANTAATILSISCSMSLVSCRHFFPTLSSQRHQNAATFNRWMKSASFAGQTSIESDIPSWFLSVRGGADVSSTAAEAGLAPVDGTIQSLYLPGLLDISIHRPNMVRFFMRYTVYSFPNCDAVELI